MEYLHLVVTCELAAYENQLVDSINEGLNTDDDLLKYARLINNVTISDYHSTLLVVKAYLIGKLWRNDIQAANLKADLHPVFDKLTDQITFLNKNNFFS